MSADVRYFYTVNVGLLAVATVIITTVLLINIGNIQRSSDQRTTRINVARYEACGQITDDALRTICVTQAR